MKKRIFAVIIVVLIILVILKISMFNPTIIEEFTEGEEEYYQEVEKKSIIGKGKIVSFNIEKLDTGYWNNIDDVYVKDGELVTANQKILKVSNKDENGLIYSTIKGKVFINDSTDEKEYYIFDLDNVGFEIEVDEKDSAKLKIGQLVNVNIDAISNTLTGKIYYISKISNDGVIKIKIKLDYNEKIKFGYTARAEILIDKDIDTNVKEFDSKNSFPKIGKTVITYKNEPEQEMYNEEIEEPLDEENEEEAEFDTEEISKYYNEYWNKYWSKHWEEHWNQYWNEFWEDYWKNNPPGDDENTDNEENTPETPTDENNNL